MPGLDVAGLGVWLPGPGVIHEDVTFAVPAGRVLLVAGVNASGTSTLLNAIAGALPPGARQVGTIALAGQHLGRAHPDELAALVGRFAGPVAPRGLGVAAWLRAAARRASSDRHDALVAEFGLAPLLGTTTDRLASDERARVAFVALLLRAPSLLLLDQPLTALGARWRAAACARIREHADAGGIVLWAEHRGDWAVLNADLVLEVGNGPGAHAVARWQPTTLPVSAPHRLAAAVGGPPPEGLREEWLADALARRLPATLTIRRGASRRGLLTPLDLGDGLDRVVDQDEPPVVICADRSQARAARAAIGAAWGVRPPAVPALDTVAGVVRGAERRLRLPGGSLARTVQARVPRLRWRDSLAHHAQGEQTLVRNEVALADPGPILMDDPFRHLDPGHVAEAVARITAAWASGRPVLAVTTEVEAAGWFPRVLVWHEGAVVADGRGSSVLDALPSSPLLARLVPGRPVVDAGVLLDSLEGARA